MTGPELTSAGIADPDAHAGAGRSGLTHLEELQLAASVHGLERLHPELSARRTFSRGAIVVVSVALVVAVVALVLAPIGTLVVFTGGVVVLYAVSLAYRVMLYFLSRGEQAMVRIEDDAARAIPAADLPVYTVLIPAYAEAASLAQAMNAIAALEYPADKLDVKLLLEADDDETLAAAAAMDLPAGVEIVRVPVAAPRTKPKACNYGLIAARGEYVTIYDAEDVPDPLQLRRAVAAFRELPPEVACLQARLGFYNEHQNLITRWFTLDYGMWFVELLPGLVRSGSPIPLGGTSNHFRSDTLRELGGWDPYNVTEDADLGVRLARMGFRVGILDSVTHEEATSDFVNWVKQRSRWYKGYFQTWLVHMRNPRRLVHDLGWRGFVGFNLFVGGTPLLAVTNVASWTLTILWFARQPAWIVQLFPSWIYYLGLVCFVVGNFVCIYLGVASARATDNVDLVGWAFLMPVYWLMMSLAACKAVLQLVTNPSFWEKTTHGMHSAPVVDLTAEEIADVERRAPGERGSAVAAGT